MKTSRRVIDLIKKFEGFRSEAYQDGGGCWTIGYGSTHGGLPGMCINEDKAEEWLLRDIREVEKQVSETVTVPLTENECSALVSFTYNLGIGALRGSTLLKKLNARDTVGAADEFQKWDCLGGVPIRGLLRRRTIERDIFLNAMSPVR